MATPAKYNVKILILGETAVGKTSLLVRYTLNEFSENRNASLGGKKRKKNKLGNLNLKINY